MRDGLLRSTALQAAIMVAAAPALVHQARAQPAPTARPTGGTVVGGAASIAQNTAATTVTQSTQRAAIDWRSFDVGAAHTVTFQQPGATAVILNRVTGPDPSQIAGRISANGQVVITNQSGVVFHQGSQVDTAGLIVSAAGITNPNFMAGRMVFDQAPRPDAAVTNAGTITVKETGLAALVAPRVANSGVINARMGRAVLAGAETHTLDLYGDGLLAIDVTGQVRTAPKGPDGKPVTALVTNTGTVIADHGSVTITAAAADGIVQNLVQAGGTLRAKGGTVVLAGVGGSLRIEGRVAADAGGSVTANATGAVTVAAAARVTANGGGRVAIGSRTSAATTVEAGARIAADGRRGGNGGRVAILSGGLTTMNGAISARGSRTGGNGGAVEVSGKTLALTGAIDTGAPAGRVGTILLDPTDVTISDHGGAGTVIDPATLQAMTGDVTVQADNSITASSSVTLSGARQNFTLDAGNVIRVDAGVTLDATGTVTFISGAQGVSLLGSVTARGSGGMVFNVAGPVTQGAGSTVSTGLLTGAVGSLALNSTTNRIAQIGGDGFFSGSGTPLIASSGDISVTSSSLPLTVKGAYFDAGIQVPNGQTISLFADTMRFLSGTVGGPSASAPGGTIALAPISAGRPMEITYSAATPNTLSISFGDLSNLKAPTLSLGSAATGNITLNVGTSVPTLDFGTYGIQSLLLRSGADIGQGGRVSVQRISATGVNIDLGAFGNDIPNVDLLAATTNVNFAAFDFTVNGPVSGSGAVTLTNYSSGTMTIAADVTAGDLNLSAFADGPAGPINQTAGTITANTLTVDAGSANLTRANVGIIDNVRVDSGFTFASSGSTQLRGDIQTDSGALTFNVAGSVQQIAGALSTPVLSGASGSASFNSATNAVAALQNFTTTTGSLSLATGLTFSPGGVSVPVQLPLTIAGANSVPTGQALTITADRVAFSTGATVSAPSGVTTFKPLTGARPIEVVSTASEQVTTALSLTQADINAITTGTLTLGSPSAGAIQMGKGAYTLAFGGHATTLNLLSSGDVLQNVNSAVSVPILTLNAAQLLFNDTPGNAIGQLGAATTTGVLQLHNEIALTVSGPVVAGGDILLLGPTFGPLLSFTGNVQAPNIVLSVGTGGIAQTAGTITTPGTLTLSTAGAAIQSGTGVVNAGILTGSAASASLGAAGNVIPVLNGYTATGNVLLRTSGALSVTGGNSANQFDLGGTSIAVNGSVTTTAALNLAAAGAVTQGAGSSVTAAVLIGNAGSVLLNRNVNVQTLGVFNTAGAFTLSDSIPLTVAGGVTAGTSIALTSTGNLTATGGIAAPTITLVATRPVSSTGTVNVLQSSGAIAATGTLTITAPDAVTQTGGTMSAATLTGSSGAATSLASANTITNLGPYTSGGNFTLNDTGCGCGLAITGALNAGVNTVTLTTTGLTQTAAGIVTAGTLTGSSTGLVVLDNTSNQIATLGAFGSAGGFTLNDGRALAQTGALSDTAQVTLGVTGALTLGGTVTAPGVALTTTGALTQTGGGITTAALTGSTGGAALLTAANAVSGLGPFTSGGAFTLANGSNALNIAGALNAGANTVTLNAGPLTQTSPAGIITAATLTGSSTGTVALGNTGNQITNLGAFTSVGGFSLQDGRALTTTGALSDTTSIALTSSGTLTLAANVTAPRVSLTSTGGSLAFSAGTLSAPTQLDLSAATPITQPGGNGIATALLTIAAPSATLNAATNSIAALGTVAVTGAFSLTDGRSLSVSGPLTAGTSATLNVTGDLSLAANVTTPALTLNATGNVVQPSGTIAVTTLTGGAGAATSLTGANTIANLGAYASGGNFTLNDTAALTITGALNAGVNTVTLTTTGLTQTAAGIVTAGTLTGSSTGLVVLDNTSNQIATLGAFGSAGGFTLNDGRALAQTGALSDTAQVTLGVTGALTLGGTVTAPGVALTTTGALTQTGGGITTAALTGSTGGAALLTAANAVSGLGPFTSGGAFTLANGSNALNIAGALNAGANTVTLNAGPLTQTSPAGIITAATLTGSSTGTVALGNTGNQITNLGAFTSVGGFSLQDGRALTTTGALSDTTSIALTSSGTLTLAANVTAPRVSLTSTGGSLAFSAGTLSAPTQLDLSAATPITQPGGNGIATALLTIAAPSATLNAATNSIAALGTVAVTGAFSLTDGRSLSVSGPLTAGASATLNVTGDLSLAANVTTPALTLNATGNVVQPSGGITATTVSGTAGGSFLLGSSTNSIANLGPVTAAVAIGITDARSLAVVGAIDPPDITFNITGDLALNSTVVGGTVTFNVTGAVTEGASGTLTADRIRGATGSTVLNAASVGTVQDFASVGVFQLVDAVPLTIAGPLSAGSTLTATGFNLLTIAGDVTAPNVVLGTVLTRFGRVVQTAGAITGSTSVRISALDDIAQTGGAIVTPLLLGSAGTTASFASAANAVSGLGPFTSGGAFTLANGSNALNVAGALNAGANTVTLNAGPLTQTSPAGIITAATLTGSSTGTVALGNTGNQITNLGAFTSVGGFSLQDGRALTTTGALSDTTSIALTSSGTLTLAANVTAPRVSLTSTGGSLAFSAGTLSAPTQLDLSAATPITQPGGNGIATALLTIAAPSATLNAATNSIAALGTVAVTGAFSLTDGRSLSVSGPLAAGASATLNVTGDLSLAANVTTPALTLNATGNVVQPSGGITATTVSGTAGGSFLLGSSTNSIANLGPVTAAVAIGITDARSLAVVGAIDPPDITFNITGDLALNSTVVGGTVTFNVTGAVTEGASGTLTADRIRGVTGSTALTAASVGTVQDFASAGVFQLFDAVPLTITGPLSAGSTLTATGLGTLTVAGNVTAANVILSSVLPRTGRVLQTAGTITGTSSVRISALNDVTQTGGAVVTPLLLGSAGTTASFASATNAVNQVTYNSASGFTLRNNQALTANGLTDGVSVGLNVTGPLTIAGVVAAPTIDLAATGAVAETATGFLSGTTLTGAVGSATLGTGANAVTNLGAFTAIGDLFYASGSALNVNGAVAVGAGRTLTITPAGLTFAAGGSLAAPGGTVVLAPIAAGAPFALSSLATTGVPVTAATLQIGTAAAGDIAVSGSFALSNVGTLALVSAGAITEAAGASITAPRLTANASSVRLDQTNAIPTLGDSAATGAFTLNTTGALTVAGTFRAGSALALGGSSIALGIAGAATGVPALLTTPGAVTLTAANTVTEPNGAIQAGSLTGSAGASANLGGANVVPVLAGFTVPGAGGAFTLATSGPLAVTGPVAASLANGAVSLTSIGALTITTGITAATATLAGSAITQTAGLNAIGTLNLASGSDATILAGVATLGAATAPGTIRLTNVGGPATTTIAGPVTTNTLDLSGNAFTLAGAITANTLRIATGNLVQSGGTLQLGTVTGASTGSVALGGAGAAAVSALADLATTSNLSVASTVPLTLSGTIRAATIGVQAPLVTLQGGAITAATIGVTGTGAGIAQTGTTLLTTNLGPATLSVRGGAVRLNDLRGTTVNLTLVLGTGTASGNLNVASLLVDGRAGSATLFGAIGGLTGFDAATAARIVQFDTAYTLNGCAIAAASCVPAPPLPTVRIVEPSILRPDIILVEGALRPDLFTADLVTVEVVRNPSDPDFALPNISDRDY